MIISTHAGAMLKISVSDSSTGRSGGRGYYIAAPLVPSTALNCELDALCERECVGVVDGRGLTAHVGAPRIRTALASAAGFLLAAECSADLGPRRPDVHIGDSAIGARGCDKLLRFLHVRGEDAGRETLRH